MTKACAPLEPIEENVHHQCSCLQEKNVLDRGYVEVNSRISFALIGRFDRPGTDRHREGAVTGDVCCPTLKMRFHFPN